MIGKLRRVGSKLLRTFASLPLRVLAPASRAAALEELSQEMVFTAPVPGSVIRFYAPSPLLRFRASTILSKEADTIQWIDRFEKGAVFWDIGANVGVYSLYAATCRKVKALAFEPSAANFYVLDRNIQLNQATDRVTGYCLAFSDRTELGVLNLSAQQLGGSLNQFGAPGSKSPYATNNDNSTHGMLGISIDTFMTEFEPTFPNYMKIDVDGLELSILKGARETLSDPRLHGLMVELSVTNTPENHEAMVLLAEHGWRLISRGELQGGGVEQAANHFFGRADGFKRE